MKERIIWLSALTLTLAATVFFIIRSVNLNKEYLKAVSNNKAYIAQLEENKANSIVFHTTIDQLKYNNDSISKKLVEAKEQLKLKDKQIKQLNYLSTSFKKLDTIVLSDTIFVDKNFILDTTIGDKWMNTHMVLEYPGTITVEPTAVSEKEVIIYSKKETVDTPKKFFLFRWFQKKHTVIEATVIESNPHITSQKNVFVKTQD